MPPRSWIGTSAARFVLAAGECDLEFPAEVLRVRMAQQVKRHRLGIGRDVERFGMADAGQRAGGDVADRVAARLAGGDPDRRQPAKDRGGIFNMNVSEAECPAGW